MTKPSAIAGWVGLGILGLMMIGGFLRTDSGGWQLGEDGPGGTSRAMLACARIDRLFPLKDPKVQGSRSAVDQWHDTYHTTVAKIVDAHLQQDQKVDCGVSKVLASKPLRSLAVQLPPWLDGEPVYESDVASVLLTYKDAYECALRARADTITPAVARERMAPSGNDGEGNDATSGGTQDDPQTAPAGNEDVGNATAGGGTQGQSFYDITEESGRQMALIDEELATVGPILHRTLRYVGAIDSLSPLPANLECLERASLDIRNNLSLIAQTASCFERQTGRGTRRNVLPSPPINPGVPLGNSGNGNISGRLPQGVPLVGGGVNRWGIPMNIPVGVPSWWPWWDNPWTPWFGGQSSSQTSPQNPMDGGQSSSQASIPIPIANPTPNPLANPQNPFIPDESPLGPQGNGPPNPLANPQNPIADPTPTPPGGTNPLLNLQNPFIPGESPLSPQGNGTPNPLANPQIPIADPTLGSPSAQPSLPPNFSNTNPISAP